MRFLLDTYTFLLWNLNDSRLSDVVKQIIQDGRNQIYLSAASSWEVAIKAGKGRLDLPVSPDQFIAESLRANSFNALPIEVSHTVEVYHLPDLHSDPFDRMLIAQSRMEHLPLLTADADIARCDVTVLW